MIRIGRYNDLPVLSQLPRGLQLDGGRYGEILLPKQYLTGDEQVGDVLRVFIYCDSEDRLIATTETPKVQVGEFAYLNVVDESRHGCFLDWGLPKDLFVPFSEQKQTLQKGRQALVRVYLDDSNRIAASARIDRFLQDTDDSCQFKQGEEVTIVAADKSDLGLKVIVNGTHWGLIYTTDLFEPLKRGETRQAYIKRVREDQKLEISLRPLGFAKVEGLAAEVLQKLKDEKGFIAISDKSSPEAIKRVFKCSKNAYKQAIGNLYKQKLIKIEKDGIHLV
ncbi:CvfB family protein [Litoribrevibacter albus]|uniref:GntR family transcriptional regulator n=1 Tax=Litoribrevibacter albus TaxID=1473156 RepID=A0AA37SF51_9GAMM|nr:S1-like domain-containing RNA-binding protein [Litoribrevibacter albus]GLQ33422.1 GntR family transcriptional regulator [Litoribrevibacter albus]